MKDEYKLNTKLVHTGRNPDDYYGIVNPPVARTSTILYPNCAAYDDPAHTFRYGRTGNPMSRAFEKSMTLLENGFDAVSSNTGLSAVTTAILSVVKSGDHFLMVDTVYPPARDFCNNHLTRMGVEVEYYDPCIGAGIGDLIRENTSVIYMESPGSGTFEVQDVPAITKAAKDKNIITMIDNTWAAGVLFKPLDHGVDLSIQSCTKYIGGHSDINLGIIVAKTEEYYKQVKHTALDMGIAATAEDMYLGLRGLRTLPLRMREAEKQATDLAKWLKGRPEVKRVFHPAIEDHPTHNIWKRDFSGANGVFSILLHEGVTEKIYAFVDALELFPVGSSWGGYECLLQPQHPESCRTATSWEEKGALLRLQVGFEDLEDLKADLDQAFTKLK